MPGGNSAILAVVPTSNSASFQVVPPGTIFILAVISVENSGVQCTRQSSYSSNQVVPTVLDPGGTEQLEYHPLCILPGPELRIARTKKTAQKSIGERAPRSQIAEKSARKSLQSQKAFERDRKVLLLILSKNH